MRESFLGGRRPALLIWGMVAIVTLIGLTLTISLFLVLRHNAWGSFQTSFLQDAMTRGQSISQELERQMDRLDGLSRFMDSKESVEREEFGLYVKPLLKGVPVRALEWVPRVSSKERIFYESSARQDGIEGYQFYEKDEQDKNIPVLARDEYFPVYYLEPMKGNEAALGFDLASEPLRYAAMEKSCDTGQPVATPPLVLVQEGQKKTGILVFMPVYTKDLPKRTVVQRRKSLKGFVLAAYNADEFLEGVYLRLPTEGLTCLIEDLTAFQDRRVLYRHELKGEMVDWNRPFLKYEAPLAMPDRHWRVTIIPGREYIESNLSKAYWWVLPFGIFLTALLAAFLNFLATARYRAENLVKLRTKEIAERKQAEMELKKAYDDLKEVHGQLIQSEKMASIGQLAAGVAHEINNPVGFINSNVEILEQYVSEYIKILRMMENLQKIVEAEDMPQAKAIVKEMVQFEQEIDLEHTINDVGNLLQHTRRGIERIQKTVMDLRTFARKDNSAMDLVRIEDVIDGILNIVHNELKYKADLKKNYGQTPLVYCSMQRLGQVFINLLVNAVQAIEEKGTIEIRTYNQDQYVCVDITDTGKGIGPENLKKIFDPFFTTKPVGQGTGLGLSVSYEIVKKHGGEIKVQSEVGKGTTFTIMLPVKA